MTDWLQTILAADANGGTWMLLWLALFTLVSEDLACIAAGLLVAQGRASFMPVTVACFLGIFGGDMAVVFLGRVVGRRVLQLPPLKWWVSAESVERAERWFHQRGGRLILMSRFMPGTRFPTYVAAGLLRVPLRRFIGWFVLACAIWTPLLVGAAVIMGEGALNFFEGWRHAVPAMLVGGLLLWLGWRLAIQATTWRGRRLLLSRWRRLTRWEFWPMWAVYPPVFIYGLWLAVKYRGVTVFTAVNPGIGAGGGLKGESKSEILKGLTGAGDAVARWCLLERASSDVRAEVLRNFMQREGLDFPVVLKPDVGERGFGVVIAKNWSEARQALAFHRVRLLAQEYVPGVEFGVFYYRRPSWQQGRILAVTDKRMLSVQGDGQRTLEQLILADDRAVCLGPMFLKSFPSRLDEVPKKGQAVVLTELGTHCRGALFLDGTHLVTPELMDKIEQTSRVFPGFNFGRYDVRAASTEAFQTGNFKVIELNGLTSEATSIYDPSHSVWQGWAMLCRQWKIAFEIGAENRELGLRSLSLREIWQLVATNQTSS